MLITKRVNAAVATSAGGLEADAFCRSVCLGWHRSDKHRLWQLQGAANHSSTSGVLLAAAPIATAAPSEDDADSFFFLTLSALSARTRLNGYAIPSVSFADAVVVAANRGLSLLGSLLWPHTLSSAPLFVLRFLIYGSGACSD